MLALAKTKSLYILHVVIIYKHEQAGYYIKHTISTFVP